MEVALAISAGLAMILLIGYALRSIWADDQKPGPPFKSGESTHEIVENWSGANHTEIPPSHDHH
jgi:hypothetical protein